MKKKGNARLPLWINFDVFSWDSSAGWVLDKLPLGRFYQADGEVPK